jgi:integrase
MGEGGGLMGEDVMITVKLRYVVEDVDRHGNVRLYFRRRGQKKIRLRDKPGTPEFNTAYAEAFAVREAAASVTEVSNTPNTWRWLCLRYFQSAEFRQLDPANTQRPQRGILESTWAEPSAPGSTALIGDCPLDRMGPKIIRVLRDRKANFAAAANNRLKAIRRVFTWAIEQQLVAFNPARDVPRLRTRADGYHTWTADEIAQYERRHLVGTSAHLALALLRYTGQRRADIVHFGRQHVRDGCLKFTQNKNRNRNPVQLDLPILPELQRVIDASPTGDLAFLVTEYGRPFTAAGFGNKFREWCNEAGLQHCSAHGLRKAAATSYAEAGASAHMLMAWFGWKSLRQPEHYTRAANQKKLAASVVPLLRRAKDGT